ncbi:MAG: Hsp33 family molecular chaperone [Clostridiales bacterium]|jgi:molecular chaperone Hsp33|nr:Hsp33 family molecular chaperone [Clostridiales bacterium]
MDYILRATAADNQIRAFVINSRDLVEEARSIHNTSPVMTAALGRLLTAGAMMGCMLKNEEDILTLSIQCDGEAKGLLVTADNSVKVRGYANNPDVMLPPNSKGKLDVAGALGLGVLSVVKDIGLKAPYNGQTILVTSEIAEDITYYFATSEQTPSAVALGVLMNRDNTVRQAGGFIFQLMPGANEEVIVELEKALNSVNSITSLLDEGYTPEMILEKLLGHLGYQILDTVPAEFKCNCSKERVSNALAAIGRKDLEEIIEDGEDIEMSCHFCNQNYIFNVDDVKTLIENSDRMKSK